MAVEVSTSYEIENDKAFTAKLKQLAKKSSDLTIPLTLISKDFYKSEKSIFLLKGPGKYKDLSDVYKKRKQKAVGFIYPILKRSGALEKSVTSPSDRSSINQIVNKNTLIIGTKTPYGVFHQSDSPRSKIPLRKFLFIGPEAIQFATSATKGRLERWIGILDGFMQSVIDTEF